MSSAAPSPPAPSPSAPAPRAPLSRWRFVIAPKWLAWHLFTVAAVIGMLWLGDWQFHRAEGGNALSWAYTFEWPVFAVFGVVFWAKTILDEGKPKQAGPGVGQPEDDPDLDQYNAYLDRLTRQDQDEAASRGRRPR
jgi:hypothetical protein